jgi:hypothetical protein
MEEVMITRAEHLDWCKEKAMECVHRGDLRDAIDTMLSLLDTHPETANPGSFARTLGYLLDGKGDRGLVIRWINAFK